MNLLPKDDAFFKLFSKSADKAYDAAVILQQMTKEIDDIKKVEAGAKKIKEIEEENDKNTHDILQLLNHSFVTPLDREDIYLIAKDLDEILDIIEDASYFLMSINVNKIREEAATLCDLIVKGCIGVQKIMEALKNRKNIKDLASLIIEVNGFENEGDGVYRLAIKKLFADESRVGCRKLLAIKFHSANVEFFLKHLRYFVDFERLPFTRLDSVIKKKTSNSRI